MQKSNIKIKKQRGMVLAVSLYVLVILMTLGFTLITTSIAELHNAENSKNSTLAFYLADAGIEEALANWANNPLILNTLNTQPVSISYLCSSQDPRNGKTINQGIYTVYMEKLPLKPGESPLYKLFSFGFLIDPQNFSYQNLGASKAQRALMALVREKTSNYVLFSNDGTSGIYSYPYGFNYHGQINGDVRLNSNIYISGNYGKINFNNKIEITGVQIGGIRPNPKGGFYPQSEFLAFPSIDFINLAQIAEKQHQIITPSVFNSVITTNYHWRVVQKSGTGMFYLDNIRKSNSPWVPQLQNEPCTITLYPDEPIIRGINYRDSTGAHGTSCPTPPEGIFFVSGDIALRGTLKGKLTIVCDGNLIINGDIKMADQDSHLGIIAAGNIYLSGKNDLSVEASLLSYKRIIYPDSLPGMWMKCLPYEEVNSAPKNNANLKIIGAVYSALPFEPAKNNYQGYINVNLIYDQRLKISSPPGFPVVKPLSANKSFEVVYWKDVTALGVK